jgi:ABC-type Zn2+ transport system substrate-binding protein/surface adhesin
VYTIAKDANNSKLTYSQKLQAVVLLNSLVEMYKGNADKLKQFLATFQAILQDKSDTLADQIENTDEYEKDELALLK